MRLILSVAFAALAFGAACGEKSHHDGAADEIERRRVAEEMEAEFERLERNFDELEARAKQEQREVEVELQQARSEARREFEAMKASQQDRWQDTREKSKAALERFRDKIDRATDELKR